MEIGSGLVLVLLVVVVVDVVDVVVVVVAVVVVVVVVEHLFREILGELVESSQTVKYEGFLIIRVDKFDTLFFQTWNALNKNEHVANAIWQLPQHFTVCFSKQTGQF